MFENVCIYLQFIDFLIKKVFPFMQIYIYLISLIQCVILLDLCSNVFCLLYIQMSYVYLPTYLPTHLPTYLPNYLPNYQPT